MKKTRKKIKLNFQIFYKCLKKDSKQKVTHRRRKNKCNSPSVISEENKKRK